MPKKKKKKWGKADLTTVLRIRELPHLHMKLAVWFSFPTTNNKIPEVLCPFTIIPSTQTKSLPRIICYAIKSCIVPVKKPFIKEKFD